MSVIDSIVGHEGFRSHVYLDAQGFLSLGHGTTVGRISGDSIYSLAFHSDGVGITKAQARGLVKDRVSQIRERLARLVDEWWGLSKERRDVLVEMAYQLGVNGLMNFKRMFLALAERDYERAAAEMLDSRWARQTPERARRLTEIMLMNEL